MDVTIDTPRTGGAGDASSCGLAGIAMTEQPPADPRPILGRSCEQPERRSAGGPDGDSQETDPARSTTTFTAFPRTRIDRRFRQAQPPAFGLLAVILHVDPDHSRDVREAVGYDARQCPVAQADNFRTRRLNLAGRAHRPVAAPAFCLLDGELGAIIRKAGGSLAAPSGL